MENIKNEWHSPTNIGVFAWAAIISEQNWFKVARKFLKRVDEELSDTDAFAPLCYFIGADTPEGHQFWADVNDRAVEVIGNTGSSIKQEKDVGKDTDIDKIIDELLATDAWKMTIDTMVKLESWITKEQLISAIKNQAKQDSNAKERLNALLTRAKRTKNL